MSLPTTDSSLLNHIQELVEQEQQLRFAAVITQEEELRLKDIKVERDQYWDWLRQRRALRETGQDPDKAEVRPPEIVAKYVQ
ncbi:hypothetical protein W02_03670 [Nitrospira sp. KM1]|uniref:DUF2630 family protein n=1 Tax=Nitrospira sp. KM1 TaxID=1936990 RepID=UPI0013A71EB2|nr:DUF2630 family protein [Nitrospira sp. KM1]BCA53227.1 hypothetical protein W02_03670 [Nitrospira sp. KM1]